MKELEEKLGYIFENKAFLNQALTRESAIQEHLPDAAKQSYQTLEFVGDAALKHAISRVIFQKLQGKYPEGVLHECTKKLITNENILPQIADSINLSKFIMRGKGEVLLTPKMKADAMEAILGAISMDNQSQEILFRVVERLWKPYLEKVLLEVETLSKLPVKPNVLPLTTAASSSSSIVSTNASVPEKQNKTKTPSPPTPRTQRLFTGVGPQISAEQFQKYVSQAPDVNRQKIGKAGDTALMALLRKDNLRSDKEIPKIEILLKHGALWTVKNKKGETAEDLAKKHDKNVIQRLKGIKSHT